MDRFERIRLKKEPERKEYEAALRARLRLIDCPVCEKQVAVELHLQLVRPEATDSFVCTANCGHIEAKENAQKALTEAIIAHANDVNP